MSATLSSATAETELSLRKAFAQFDAAVAVKQYTPIRKSGSAGQRIIAALSAATQQPKQDHAELVRKFSADIKQALLPLEHIEAEALSLMNVANHIESGETLAGDIGHELAALAKTLRKASVAGLVDGSAIAAQVRRRVSDAAVEVKRLNHSLVDKSKSAARVAQSKALASMLRSAGMDTTYAEQRVQRALAVHRWKHEAAPRRKPLTKGLGK